MEKWLKVLVIFMCALGCLFGMASVVEKDRNFASYAEVAQVDPPKTYIKKTAITKRLLGPDSKSTQILADMWYLDKNNKQVTFKHVLSEDIISQFSRNEPVYVEYIPNERNTERFKGEGQTSFAFSLVFMGSTFLVLLLMLVREFKRPFDSW